MAKWSQYIFIAAWCQHKIQAVNCYKWHQEGYEPHAKLLRLYINNNNKKRVWIHLFCLKNTLGLGADTKTSIIWQPSVPLARIQWVSFSFNRPLFPSAKNKQTEEQQGVVLTGSFLSKHSLLICEKVPCEQPHRFSLLWITFACFYVLLFAERHGWLGGEEPPHRVSQIIGRRGAGGGSLRRRAQSSVRPPQVGVRRRLLTS